MEDEDEFGDLYTDVLRQFHPSSVLQPSTEQPKHPSPKRPIDHSVQSNDEEILFGASDPNPPFNFAGSHHTQNLVLKSTNSAPEPGLAKRSDSRLDLNHEMVKDEGASDLQDPIVSRVLESGCNEKLQGMAQKSMDECRVDFVVEEKSDKDICSVEKDQGLIVKEENFEKFHIEEAEKPVIPGVSDAADHGGEGNDWDSDSDDDLNIVLNETNHGPAVMDGLVGSGHEDDEDEVPLVIVVDSEPGHLPMEEREWGEDAAQAADGERKELGEAAKVNGAAVGAPKILYNSNFSYQPYHSQFKYVRPGAAPIPGAPGQIRPPVNTGPVGGFGRGDWRPSGMRNTFLMQNNSHPGLGMNGGWGNGTTGRGFGSGLDFTLPSHKTIFEVDLDSFEEKSWRLPGLDMSDFFNFGLNEESWKVYCKQLEQLRVETTMQSKIRVYEGGRSQQEYDPDLPPELAAAGAAGAANIRDIFSENANIGVAKGLTDVRQPVTIGRAIQVETNFVERLPSTDTRPLRIRDSDVIIEIVLQGSTDDTSLPVNDVTEQPENEPLMENFKGDQETNGGIAGEALLPYCLNSSEQHSAFPGRDGGTLNEERQTKERECNRSPIINRSCSTLDKEILGNQNEDSVESISGKHSNQLSYPVTIGSAEERDIEHGDALHGSSVMSDREEMALTDVHIGGNLLPSVKKRKLSSRIEQSPDQQIGDRGNLKAAKSRENSIARSDSSRDYYKLRNSTDEDVVQHGRSTRMRNIKRPHVDDEQSERIKSRDERREVEKHYMAEKGWENSHSHQYLDPRSTRHLHMKNEGIDRRKGGENSEGSWQRRDDDPRGRMTRVEETRNNVREREKTDKDEHFQLRKQLDNCNFRVYHDKDVGSRSRERDDNSKNRYESMNDHYSKRRKEEDYSRRDVEKEELLHNHKESLDRRKRERNDALDMRKRDDQVRTREDMYSSVRHKEDGWIHRERDQMHKSKQSHEESLSKREREEERERVRKRDRDAEEKTWILDSREYKDTFDRDYKFKNTGRHNEQLKRRVEDGSLSQHRGREDHLHSTRGSQVNKDERRSRHERESTRRELVDGGSVNNRVHEKNRKENTRSKDSEGEDHNYGGPSTRNQEDQNGHVNEPAILKGITEKRKHNEDVSDDEKQRDSRRGRSKLERWTGHKESDFNIDSKSSSSSTKVKESDEYKNGAREESSKTVDTIDDDPCPLGDRKEEKSVDGRQHSDTVDKLKQRRERFKLPMPRHKEATGVKKMEVESLPSAQSEDSEIKPERPPRKRRWISN